MRVESQEAPVENPEAIGKFESKHGPSKQLYSISGRNLDQEVKQSDFLRMVILSANSNMDPEGFIPIMLVFGTIPRSAPPEVTHPPLKFNYFAQWKRTFQKSRKNMRDAEFCLD